jgi:hypothetical protein
VRARARTLFHPGESRIAYPAAIRRLYIRFSSLVSPSILYALVFVTRALFLFVLHGGTIASSSPFFNFSPVFRLPVVFFLSIGFLPGFLFPLFLLLFFLSARFSSFAASLPTLFFLFSLSVTLETHERRLSFSPSCSLPLSSLSVGWRSACLTSRRPTSSPSTADTRLLSPLAARAGHSFRLVRSTPLVFRAHTAAPSLFLAPE